MATNQVEPIEQDYFAWLISQIEVPRNGKTYNELFGRMHNTEFVFIVPNDDNRIQDGKELRYEFSNEARLALLEVIPRMDGISFLEVLIGLSRRAAFADGDAPARWWAWKLIKNLKLNRMSDPLTPANLNKIDGILEAVVWRTYRGDGLGGFFPLRRPTKDQTKVEIWYQMNAYLIENQNL